MNIAGNITPGLHCLISNLVLQIVAAAMSPHAKRYQDMEELAVYDPEHFRPVVRVSSEF